MKYYIGLLIAVGLGAYYYGRESVVIPEIKVAKIIDKDVKETTTTTKNKDGTVVTVKTKDTTVRSQTKTEVTPKSSTVHVQALFGYNLTRVAEERRTYYGISVSKTLVGPITGGLFVITDGKSNPVGGLSLGMELP